MEVYHIRDSVRNVSLAYGSFFYCAILYLVFRRSLYSGAIPILIFSLLYLYVMGKGYLGPYFARPAMVLFPGFCVLVGIACADFQFRLRNNRTIAIAFNYCYSYSFWHHLSRSM